MSNGGAFAVFVGALAGGLWWLTRQGRQEEAPGPTPQGPVTITIRDEDGNIVLPDNLVGRRGVRRGVGVLPTGLYEGSAYTLELKVTNTSRKTFQDLTALDVPATFDIEYFDTFDPKITLPGKKVMSSSFAGNETKTFLHSFTIPAGYGGKTGTFIGNVFLVGEFDVLAQVISANYTIKTVAITYGATITIT